MMLLVSTLLRWLHLFPAIALVGGIFFIRFALLPAEGELEDAARESLRESVRRRWSRVVMLSAALLLVSGLINTAMISKAYAFPDGYYMPLLGVKLVLALAILYISSLLAGRSENARRFREKLAFWANVNCLLAVLLVLVAGAMRTAERVEKDGNPEAPAARAPAESESSAQFALRSSKL